MPKIHKTTDSTDSLKYLNNGWLSLFNLYLTPLLGLL
jgi:hypothetical protein